MSEESKLVDAELNEDVAATALQTQSLSISDEAEDEDTSSKTTQDSGEGATGKKKKSKRAKLKKALGGIEGTKNDAESSANPSSKLTSGMVEQLLEMNPSLKGEVAGMDKEKAAEKLKTLDVASLLTGMVCHCRYGI